MHRLEVNKKVMSYMTTDRFYELQFFFFFQRFYNIPSSLPRMQLCMFDDE